MRLFTGGRSSVAGSVLDRRHVQDSSRYNHHQFDRGRSDHHVKRAGHLLCGNEATIAIQIEYFTGMSSWEGRFGWPGLSTFRHRYAWKQRKSLAWVPFARP